MIGGIIRWWAALALWIFNPYRDLLAVLFGHGSVVRHTYYLTVRVLLTMLAQLVGHGRPTPPSSAANFAHP